jgi:hypothetical protein
MSVRFHVDLLHPGSVARTWQESFVGPRGITTLLLFSLGCVVVLLLILVSTILPTYWRLAADLNAVPSLRKDLAVREADLGILRSNLGALSEEARRQLRWAELLTVFSQQIPPALKLQLLDATRSAPPAAPGQQPQTGEPIKFENTLRIDAVTPLRPGSPPLLEVAQFMAGLMRDPAVNSRFQLKSWEIKPSAPATPGSLQLLNISILLSERTQ